MEKYLLNSAKDLEVSDCVQLYEDWKQTTFREYAKALYLLNTVVYRQY